LLALAKICAILADLGITAVVACGKYVWQHAAGSKVSKGKTKN